MRGQQGRVEIILFYFLTDRGSLCLSVSDGSDVSQECVHILTILSGVWSLLTPVLHISLLTPILPQRGERPHLRNILEFLVLNSVGILRIKYQVNYFTRVVLVKIKILWTCFVFNKKFIIISVFMR